MMSNAENFSVRFEIETSDGVRPVEIGYLGAIPREGELVECNYVHGTKIKFEVSEIRHFVYNSGHDIIQRVTVRGQEI